MKLGLEGRIVLVTAGSQGIGLASARGFHSAGANVAICARSPDALTAAAMQMPGSLAIPADLTIADDIECVVQKVAEHFGTIDILVNNAGGPPAGLLETLSDNDWHRGVELTLMSAIRASRAVLPYMTARGWGRIVNISSYGVKQPVPELTISNSVRMAALGWSKTLASQVAKHNILVNTVCPGWTRTARVESLVASKATASDRAGADIEKDIVSQIPLGRLGEADEIANMVVFLGSEAASYITGTAISVDGGIVQGYA
jgi:3-oxoacyl-[acyl-carrier protein] reductase